MALPVTISGGAPAPQNSYHGPFKSSGGNYYTILLGDTGATDGEMRAFKATDPTVSFTEQDTSNRPLFDTASSDQISMNVYQVGDDLHLVGQNFSEEVNYARFDMSSDTWADIDGAGAEAVEIFDGTGGGTADACDIAVLSAAYGVGSAFVKIRVVYQGATEMDMGSAFERIDESNSVDDGVTWSAPTQIDNGASVAAKDYTGPRIVLPPSNSDQCHVIMRESDSLSNVIQRAIAGDDTLRTYRDTGLNTTGDYPITHGLGFLRSSTSKVRIGFIAATINDLVILEFDAFSDDTDRTEASSSVSTDNVQVDNGSIDACLAADGSTIRGLMVKSTNDDLFEFFDDDADSYTLQGTAHLAGTVNHISCNVYDRSGTKLAMIYDDGGTVKYDEIDLSSGHTGIAALVLEPFAMSVVGAMDPKGTVAPALEALRLAVAGAETFEAVAAPTLETPSLAVLGVMDPQGSVAPALTEFALAAQGTAGFEAVADIQVADAVLAVLGAQSHEGAVAIELSPLSLAALGLMQPEAVAAPAFEPFALATVGIQDIPGIVGAELAQIVLASAGGMAPVATVAALLAALELATSGVAGFEGTADLVLAAPALSASGVMDPQGSVAALLAKFGLTVAGLETFQGAVDARLAEFAMTVQGVMAPQGTLAPELAVLVLAASGIAGAAQGTAAPVLEPMELTAQGVMAPQGVAALDLAEFALAVGGIQDLPGVVAPNLAAFDLAASGAMDPAATVAAVLTAMEVRISGVTGFEGAGDLTLAPPSLTVSAVMLPSGVAVLNLADVGLTASALESFQGGVDARLAAFDLAVQGGMAPAGTIAALLAALEADISGVETFAGAVALNLDPFAVSLGGIQAFAGIASLKLAAVVLSIGGGTVTIIGTPFVDGATLAAVQNITTSLVATHAGGATLIATKKTGETL